MRKIVIISFFLLLLSGFATAQTISQSKVPAVVVNAFRVKFPNASEVKWKLNDGVYEVACRINQKANEVRIDYRGKILMHQQDLYISEIPKNVLSTIQSKEPFFDVNDADVVYENGNIIYQIKFENNNRERFFWIDTKGCIVKFRKELSKSEVPPVVLNLINSGFGNFDFERAKYLEEDGVNFYLVSGDINDSEHTFWITENLVLLEHQQDLRYSEIPAPVMQTIRESYRDYSVRDADLTEKGGIKTYLFRLSKTDKSIYVTLNPLGKVLNDK